MIRRKNGSDRAPIVSVLTATIPERHLMLTENMASVRAQTFHKWEHLILTDREHEGCAATTNKLAKKAAGEWLFLLNDDDLLLPGCLGAHLAAALESDPDIVYGPPLVLGEDGAQFCGSPPNIPTTALIKRSLWEKVGGYNEALSATEDRDFYTRVMARPTFARFVRIDEPTWIYRFHGSNKSRTH